MRIFSFSLCFHWWICAKWGGNGEKMASAFRIGKAAAVRKKREKAECPDRDSACVKCATRGSQGVMGIRTKLGCCL